MDKNLYQKEVLTVTDVAKILGICRVKAYQLVHQEGFPSLFIGKTIRVHRDSLYNWIQDNSSKKHK